MKIEITDLLSIENRTEERQVCTDLTSFVSKLGSFPVTKKEPFLLSLENQENKRLLIKGKTAVELSVPCDRCLKEVPVKIRITIDRELSLEEPESEEREEADGFFTGSELDVDSLIYHEILLNRPMKVLCSENCKGICRKCGTNLNDKTCSCDQREPDPRMAAIQDVFQQYKEV